ncbi:MAG: hypothetical protein HQ481_16780 [Alphaproteobacteria bacterium]|nr:hypothetical protein [Alphaproteobacteria bacterium]
MTVRLTTALALATALTLGATGIAIAKSEKPKGGAPAKVETTLKSKGKATGSLGGSDAAAATATAGATLAGILLSDQDKATISQYFQQHPQSTKGLPPGIAKNVARGKPLPPGIAKRGVPSALASKLSIPKGYDLQTVGTDVVLIEAGTRIIADVLKGVLQK